jgi:cytochrome c oxidase subunit 3/cytochrome o ubiquinol oxidase subunit 3
MNHEASASHGHGNGLDHAKVGMASFLVTEVAFFATLVTTYMFFLVQPNDPIRPTARAVFSMPLTIISTICLLSSSVTAHYAVKRLEQGEQARFRQLLGLTILLGAIFLAGTAMEWTDLITRHKVTIASGVFGTAYFTVVGFHAAHVTIGLFLLSVLFGCALAGRLGASNSKAMDLVSWYWHFVDGVWVVVFSVVYLAGR